MKKKLRKKKKKKLMGFFMTLKHIFGKNYIMIKELHLKVKDIAEVFGINANIVSRYANYQHYLDMQKIYTNTYTKKMSLSKRRKIARENTRNTLRYKDNLLTVIEEAA